MAKAKGLFTPSKGTEATSRGLVLAGVARDARLDRGYLLMIGLSSAIATLGLLQGSAAVVIGAMLVSPLMAPIMALGFGLATFDSQLLRRGAMTLAAGVIVAILVASAIILASPIKAVTAEIAARTRPTLLDLGVAIVGGLAGVHSVLYRKGTVMVGVAIATALVPPLATIGFGLVTERPQFALGASLLFITNTAAIALAATAVAMTKRFRPTLSRKQTAMQTGTILVSLLLLSVPLATGLGKIVTEARVQSGAELILTDMIGPESRVDSLAVRFERATPSISAVVLGERFQPQLEGRFAERVRKELGLPEAQVSLIQLRGQSASAVAAQEQLSAEVEAWSRDRQRAEELARALAALPGADAETILVDSRLRRASVMATEGEGEGDAGAMLTAAIPLLDRFPGWILLVEGERVVPPPPVAEPAVAAPDNAVAPAPEG